MSQGTPGDEVDRHISEALATQELAARRQVLAGLSALVDRLGRVPAPTAAFAGASAPPLRSVSAFKDTWSRLRAEQRLRQALADVPAQAGPLNSSQVVHRALQALHELSPAYLDAFIAYVDTLLALDDASGARARPARAAPALRKVPRS
jgi:hypothetical protein